MGDAGRENGAIKTNGINYPYVYVLMHIIIIIMLVIWCIYYTFISLSDKKFEAQLKCVFKLNVAIDGIECELR